MPGTSPFADHWRATLRAHYTYLVRTGDKHNEATLRALMLSQLGFTDAELRDLYLQATMHVDVVGADFVPDDAFIRAIEAEAAALTAAPPVEVPEAVIEAVAARMDATLDEPAAEAADTDDAWPPPDPDAPTQLSLF